MSHPSLTDRAGGDARSSGQNEELSPVLATDQGINRKYIDLEVTPYDFRAGILHQANSDVLEVSAGPGCS